MNAKSQHRKPTELPLFAGPEETDRPLAHRMRPRALEDFLGQRHLLGPGKPLRRAIERGQIGSMVLWGPPGCGKTTLARLIANHTDHAFEVFSAVTEGVPRVREIIREAEQRLETEGRGTILFCDEIHRFNKAQQDAFLPHVEEGLITLIGATTENPSFELNAALLSRLRVFVLEPLDADSIRAIVVQGFARLAADAGIAIGLKDEALELLVRHADGDARRALNVSEALFGHVRETAGSIEGIQSTARSKSPATAEITGRTEPTESTEPTASTRFNESIGLDESTLDESTGLDESSGLDESTEIGADVVIDVLERRIAQYDKHGEQHFNLISALHKAVRGSDVEGALYWLARILDGGEDPLYVARRVVRMASEDIGLADPRALSLALAAKDAYDFLGSPEGELAIAEAVIYLATAPKSNRAYLAWGRALEAAREHPAEPVPLHIRNAPTRLMKGLGYGKGYRYDHDEGGHAAGQEYLPEPLRGASWYDPTTHGFEKTLAERIEWWRRRKRTT